LESSQRLRDMKHIGNKHQRESKQNSDKSPYIMSIWYHKDDTVQHRNGVLCYEHLHK
jgi:hypothetical protein